MNDSEMTERIYNNISVCYVLSIYNAVIFSICFCILCGIMSIVDEQRVDEECHRQSEMELEQHNRQERDSLSHSLEEPPPPYTSSVMLNQFV